MKTFEFAQATDITEFAKTHFNDMYGQYEKIFITPDVNDYHILRVLKGYGEDYELADNSFILEHQMISKPKSERIMSMNQLKNILEEDDGGNWNYIVYQSYEECIKEVDGNYGINNLEPIKI